MTDIDLKCYEEFEDNYGKKEGFLNIKKSFIIKNGVVKIEKKEILFRLFNEPGMRLNPTIYIVEILAIMNEPYSIHVISYNHSLNIISHVYSSYITNISKILNCYGNTISNIKGDVLTPLKEYINENLI